MTEINQTYKKGDEMGSKLTFDNVAEITASGGKIPAGTPVDMESFFQKVFPTMQALDLNDDICKRGRTWIAVVDGEVVDVKKAIFLVSPAGGKWGNVCYAVTSHQSGKRIPASYDGVGIHSIGGGGVVSIPFLNIEDELYIGLVSQERPRSSVSYPTRIDGTPHFESAWLNTPPRGFIDTCEESRQEALERELEEMGVDVQKIGIQKPIPIGLPQNMDSAWFGNYTEEDGVHFYALPIDRGLVKESETAGEYVFRDDLPKSMKDLLEPMSAVRFFKWSVAALNNGDAFVSIAVGLLKSAIEEGKIKL